MASVAIYHNLACGTSRNTLAMIRNSGIEPEVVEPEVVEYLKMPPSNEQLAELIAVAAMPVRELLRRKGTAHDELGLDDQAWTDERLREVSLTAAPMQARRRVGWSGRPEPDDADHPGPGMRWQTTARR